jgi:putative membrane protein
MTLRWLLASLHLLALGIGLGAIFARARSLGDARATRDLRSVFLADNLWAAAGALWLGTGLWRAFGGIEKGAAYYLGHPLFHAKLGLFLAILVLEVWPIVALVRWRIALRGGGSPDLGRAPRLARLSYLQLALLVPIPFLAAAIARGIGA